jgi:hypothetical protein
LLALFVLVNQFDKGAADNGSFCAFGHFGDVLGRAQAEADG